MKFAWFLLTPDELKIQDVPVEAQQLRLWHCIRGIGGGGGGGGGSGRPTPPAGARSPINMSEMFQRAPAAFPCLMFYLFEIPLFYATKCSLSLCQRPRPPFIPLRGFLLCVSTGYRLPSPCNKSAEAIQSGHFNTCMHTHAHTYRRA